MLNPTDAPWRFDSPNGKCRRNAAIRHIHQARTIAIGQLPPPGPSLVPRPSRFKLALTDTSGIPEFVGARLGIWPAPYFSVGCAGRHGGTKNALPQYFARRASRNCGRGIAPNRRASSDRQEVHCFAAGGHLHMPGASGLAAVLRSKSSRPSLIACRGLKSAAPA